LGQFGVVLAVDISVSGVSLKTMAPESGDSSRAFNVSMDSFPPHLWHVDLSRASVDLERDLSPLPT